MKIGFPLALKVEAPGLAHKTEAGAVALNLHSPDELRSAYARMANARAFSLQAQINGVLLQPMAPPGIEVMIGARIDPQLGPLIVAAFGGVLVELLRDSAVELAPSNAAEAHCMLRKLKGAALFDGFRGGSKLDLGGLADILVRVFGIGIRPAGSDRRTRHQSAGMHSLDLCRGRCIDRSSARQKKRFMTTARRGAPQVSSGP